MLGILYILISIIAGYMILKWAKLRLPGWMAMAPASFLAGTLAVTWLTYIVAYLFRSMPKPLIAGNIASFAIVLTISTILFIKYGLFTRIKQGIPLIRAYVSKDTFRDWLTDAVRRHWVEALYILVVTALFSYMIFHSFRITGTSMLVGYSVYSDFGPHLAMIRSFSLGSNFPTEYPHFADGTIKYHFMFQFLAGNLEFLGLRIDWAYNLPSILSMVAFLMLLYSFAVAITGKKAAGVLTGAFFVFRSSFAFFIYAFNHGPIPSLISDFLNSAVHIGNTPYEEWGLWAQKTFINQRHFCFGLGIMLILLISVYPLFRKMFKDANRNGGSVSDSSIQDGDGVLHSGSVPDSSVRAFILSAGAWIPESIPRAVILGVILGLTTFWNGAVVIATLPILFIMALLSRHRLEFLIIAVLTLTLSYLQTLFFLGPASGSIQPRLVWGFVAPDRSIAGVAAYYTELLGILPFIVIAALFIMDRSGRWLALAFFTPFIVANALQLTPDLVVNHKYVFVTIILMNIFAAQFICALFSKKSWKTGAIAAIMVIALTATGIKDFSSLNNIDKASLAIDTEDPMKKWVQDNTGPNDIFLTEAFVTHPILLAGRKIFNGWSYFAWSAGYATDDRQRIVREIYGAASVDDLKRLAKQNKISYIVIDAKVRQSQEYKVNEDLFRSAFELVFNNEGENTQIYATMKH